MPSELACASTPFCPASSILPPTGRRCRAPILLPGPSLRTSRKSFCSCRATPREPFMEHRSRFTATTDFSAKASTRIEYGYRVILLFKGPLVPPLLLKGAHLCCPPIPRTLVP